MFILVLLCLEYSDFKYPKYYRIANFRQETADDAGILLRVVIQKRKGIKMASTKRQRIRVCLKAYDHKLIDVSSDKIVETAKRTDATVAGPIPLPTKRRIYCVLRSPHVDKKSREHFELRTHKRIIDIYDPTQQTTEELSRLDLPAGVHIEVKL